MGIELSLEVRKHYSIWVVLGCILGYDLLRAVWFDDSSDVDIPQLKITLARQPWVNTDPAEGPEEKRN